MSSQSSSAGRHHASGRMRDIWDTFSRARQRVSFTGRWTGRLPGLKCGSEWTPGHVSSDGVPKTCTTTQRENSWRAALRQCLIDLRGIHRSAGHQQATTLHSHGFIVHKSVCVCVCLEQQCWLAAEAFWSLKLVKRRTQLKTHCNYSRQIWWVEPLRRARSQRACVRVRESVSVCEWESKCVCVLVFPMEDSLETIQN